MQPTRFTKVYNQLKRRLLGNLWVARLVVVFLLASLVLVAVVLTRPYFGLLTAFFTPLESQLSNSSGRTNIAILGIGGLGHEAPDLTDTIIFASIKLGTGEITLISLPRDIWVPSMKAKINTAYHYGEKKQVGGGGLVLAKSSITEILDQPVHYAVVLDFSTFVKLVDLMGGLDVEVENSFTDPLYPISGKENDNCGNNDPKFLCRYESISFSAGNQHMDGPTALKYVRSRHSELEAEGSDFGRSRRQTQILKSLKAKLINLAKNPKNYSTLNKAYELVTSELITDFPSDKSIAIAKISLQARNHDLKTHSLSEPETLYHPPISSKEENQWVLVPKDNNPQVVFDFVKNLLN